ncbi:MAG: hypothetical protein ACYTGW_09185 [Planctomycetota bacterium]
MAEPPARRGVIPGNVVRRANQPVLVACSQGEQGPTKHPISVVPVIDGDTVVGFEVRCSCGASVVVECIYEENP